MAGRRVAQPGVAKRLRHSNGGELVRSPCGWARSFRPTDDPAGRRRGQPSARFRWRPGSLTGASCGSSRRALSQVTPVPHQPPCGVNVMTRSDSLRNGYGGARLREVVESASRASLLSVAAESLRSRRDGDGGWPPLSLLRWPVRQPESRGTQPEGRRGLTRAGPPGVNRPGRVVAWP